MPTESGCRGRDPHFPSTEAGGRPQAVMSEHGRLPAIPVGLVACPCYAPGEPNASAARAKPFPQGPEPSAYAEPPGTAPGDSTGRKALLLSDAVDTAFTLAGYAPGRGERVLVKPNLLRADALTCTHPLVVRAVCAWLLDRGVRVTVGDSPAFGSAPGVGRAIGLAAALKDLPGGSGLTVQGLGGPVIREAPGLGRIRIARRALEADSILSLPRLKAHSQMRVTCAVKNLFGCVSGVHKAIAHARHGDKGESGDNLPRYIAALLSLLPPQAALTDGIVAMHVTGPSFGKPFHAGFIAASSSCVALDTAVYSLLQLAPEDIPLWRVLQRKGIHGAFPEEITLCGDLPSSFDIAEFQVPAQLAHHSFTPGRLLSSALRRIWAGLRR